MIFVNEHFHSSRKLLSICDGNLIGKIFEERKKVLNISKNFYHGSPMYENEILTLIEEDTLLNIVGPESVDFALKNKLIEREGIMKIKRIPYAMRL